MMAHLEPVADVSTLARQILEWLKPRAVYDAKAGGDVLPKTHCLELQRQLAQLRLSHHFGATEDRRETQEGHRALCEALHWDSADNADFILLISHNKDALAGPPESPLPWELPWEPRTLEGIRVALRLIADESPTKVEAIAPSGPKRPEVKPLADVKVVVAKEVKTSFEDRALQIFVIHPDWSNSEIATEIGCHVKTLSKGKAPRLCAARQAYNEPPSIPHGSKSPDGDTEAWDD